MSSRVRQSVIVVEGESEEAFVNAVLAPAAAASGLYVTPILVRHLTADGVTSGRGGGTWKHYRRLLDPLIHQSHWHRVGLMCDLYGYPSAAPGSPCAGSPHERRKQIHAALKQEFPDARFRPCVILHEFETLVLAALNLDRSPFPQIPGIDRLVADLATYDDVELVNDSVETSPSHRIARAWPEYQKAIDGIRILQQVPLSRLLSQCATFRDWWQDFLDTSGAE